MKWHKYTYLHSERDAHFVVHRFYYVADRHDHDSFWS